MVKERREGTGRVRAQIVEPSEDKEAPVAKHGMEGLYEAWQA